MDLHACDSSCFFYVADLSRGYASSHLSFIHFTSHLWPGQLLCHWCLLKQNPLQEVQHSAVGTLWRASYFFDSLEFTSHYHYFDSQSKFCHWKELPVVLLPAAAARKSLAATTVFIHTLLVTECFWLSVQLKHLSTPQFDSYRSQTITERQCSSASFSYLIFSTWLGHDFLILVHEVIRK